MMPSRTALALRLLWLACLALVTATLLSAAPADAREVRNLNAGSIQHSDCVLCLEH